MREEGGRSPEEEPALRDATERLAGEFKGVFGTETIERLVTTSRSRLAKRATVPTFLPLLAERYARQRLSALAHAERKQGEGAPRVLFLCVRNTGRSQMALGWLKHLAGERAVAWSGGSEPAGQIDPTVLAAMAEIGIDIGAEFPKPWSEEMLAAADAVVTMGCGDACPVIAGKHYEDWALPDAHGLGLDEVRGIRAEIERRVRGLLADLGVSAADDTCHNHHQ
jgi:arsenate reductase (thioredoxin)